MKTLIFFILIILSYTTTIYAVEKNIYKVNFSTRKEVQNFIDYMNITHNFDKQQLNLLFDNYSSNEEVLNKISNPSEKLPWSKYKALLISKERIKNGKIFIQEYRDSLIKAEEKFGVPKEVIVAILGVESFYGNIVGKFPVIQSLATLAFDYPPRAKFFMKELEYFLLLTKEERLDPVKIIGSYAGAMSPAQFIASSYRSYAVDFANIGSKDLNNMVNAIGSIANYFNKHGWESHAPIIEVANFRTKKDVSKSSLYEKYINSNLALPLKKYSLKELYGNGIYGKQSNLASENHSMDTIKVNEVHDQKNFHIDHRKKVALMEFVNENNQKEYLLGYNNFFTIMKYNHSINYAMVVFLLAKSLGLSVN